MSGKNELVLADVIVWMKCILCNPSWNYYERIFKIQSVHRLLNGLSDLEVGII